MDNENLQPGELVHVVTDNPIRIYSVAHDSYNDAPDGYILLFDRMQAFAFSIVANINNVTRVYPNRIKE